MKSIAQADCIGVVEAPSPNLQISHPNPSCFCGTAVISQFITHQRSGGRSAAHSIRGGGGGQWVRQVGQQEIGRATRGLPSLTRRKPTISVPNPQSQYQTHVGHYVISTLCEGSETLTEWKFDSMTLRH